MKTIIVCCLILFTYNGADARSRQIRSLGGNIATGPSQFPYHISIRNNNNIHICGGCMVGSKWILTAAHCVVGTNPSYIIIKTISILMTGGQAVAIQQVIPYPQYNPNNPHLHDIALIRTLPLTFDPNLQPLLIPNFQIPAGTPLTATGWGSITTIGTTPISLRYVSVPTITNIQCAPLVSPNILYSGNMCTRHGNRKAMCEGDDGGPLVNNQYVHGIMSWNENPCVLGAPDVSIRVYSYRTWLWNYVP